MIPSPNSFRHFKKLRPNDSPTRWLEPGPLPAAERQVLEDRPFLREPLGRPSGGAKEIPGPQFLGTSFDRKSVGSESIPM